MENGSVDLFCWVCTLIGSTGAFGQMTLISMVRDSLCFGLVSTMGISYHPKSLQELRGLFTHYAHCNPPEQAFARPIDFILGYPDEQSMWARFYDSELRNAIWGMIKFVRKLTEKPDGRV